MQENLPPIPMIKYFKMGILISIQHHDAAALSGFLLLILRNLQFYCLTITTQSQKVLKIIGTLFCLFYLTWQSSCCLNMSLTNLMSLGKTVRVCFLV